MAVPPARRHRRLAAVLAAACACVTINASAGTASARTPDRSSRSAHLTDNQRAVLRDATRRFRDIEEAIMAGYQPTRDCVPRMGYHYVKPALAGDVSIDPTLPDILVYAPVPGESPSLAALEYFRADADGKIQTTGDRPTLFGHRFDGPMAGHPVPAGRPPMPVHYDLHVWLYKHNPRGELAPENPRVVCP